MPTKQPPSPRKRLDEKLRRILARPNCGDFIIADAKDADMAYGLCAPGSFPDGRRKTLEDYRAQIRAVIAQDIVDIMLLSASNVEQLAMREGLFAQSGMTVAVRANDTTDIWVARGGAAPAQPSLPFRSANLARAMGANAPFKGADLGLYSLTFNNDAARDRETMEAFRAFRTEAQGLGFRYFLEIFNPNTPERLSKKQYGAFLNDTVTRLLAGLTTPERPLFLKIPYNGPEALEELAAYDARVVVGILGGGAGTTRDAFQLIHDARAHGARVALFGRKINFSESPLDFIRYLRAIADGAIAPKEAVKAYHGDLRKKKMRPLRALADDLKITETALNYR